MSLLNVSIKDVNDNIIAQLEASLNQTIPLLPKSFLRVLAKVLAGVFVLLYKYGGFIFLQLFVRQASTKETIINGKSITPLIEWGRLIGIGDPGTANNAEMIIDITVTNQIGILSSGTQLINTDNGVTYITIGDILLNAPLVQATIKAVADQAGGGGQGIIGNLDPGAIVSFANPLGNVDRNAIVNTQTVTGANAEDFEVYRQRVIDRFQKRPQGGAYADYESWGLEVIGIINIYPYTSPFPGQVDVYAEATVESSGSPDGIPTGAQLQAVFDIIELDNDGLANRRPANALHNTFAIIRTGFDVTVSGLVVDNLAQVQTDITTAVNDYFLDRAPFIVGLSILPRRDRITQTALSGVVDEIVTAAGGVFSSVTIKQSGFDVGLYTLTIGEKAKASTVVFI